MVKRLLLLALTPFALMAVACGFFALSLFPAYLSQAAASADLEEQVDSFLGETQDYDCSLYVLKNGPGDEYIFLMIRKHYSDQKKVIILDPSLQVKKEYESSDLGSLHMVDAYGDFVIGREVFNQVDLAVTPASPLIIPSDNKGFFAGMNYYILNIESTLPDQLKYDKYDASWNLLETSNPYIGPGSYWLENLTYDPDRAEVALFFREGDSDSIEVAFIPAGDFPSIMPPVLSYPTIRLNEVSSDRVHYTRDGIVARHHDDRYKLYGFDGRVILEFRDSNRKDSEEVYDLEGNYYYYFIVDERRIYKCHTWW